MGDTHDAVFGQDGHSDPALKPRVDAAQSLLFGLLALHNNFIDRETLLAAFNAWVADKSRSLGTILLDKARLPAARHAVLQTLVLEHLRQHDFDPQRSLTAITVPPSVRDGLEEIPDFVLQKSLIEFCLAKSGAEHTDGESTADLGRGRLGDRGRWPVPHPPLPRPWRPGRGLRGPRPGAAPRGRAQGDQAPITPTTPTAGPVRGRGRDHRRAGASRASCRSTAWATTPTAGRSTRCGSSGATTSRRPSSISRGRGAAAATRASGRWRCAKLLRRFLDVCNAIAYAHSRGVLHRDLKPGNIMLGKYGETLVVDWGLAKSVGRPGDAAATTDERTLIRQSGSDLRGTQVGSPLGTPAFMSPEQAAGRLDELGPASDVYSLGATLVLPAHRPGAVRRPATWPSCCGRSSGANSPRRGRSRPDRPGAGGDLPEGDGDGTGRSLSPPRAWPTTSSTGWPTSRSRPSANRGPVVY